MTTTNLTALIDAYAATKSQLGKLEAEKKKLEAALAEVPAGAYESEDNRLCISDSVRLGYDADSIDALALDRETVRTHRIGLPTGKGLSA